MRESKLENDRVLNEEATLEAKCWAGASREYWRIDPRKKYCYHQWKAESLPKISMYWPEDSGRDFEADVRYAHCYSDEPNVVVEFLVNLSKVLESGHSLTNSYTSCSQCEKKSFKRLKIGHFMDKGSRKNKLSVYVQKAVQTSVQTSVQTAEPGSDIYKPGDDGYIQIVVAPEGYGECGPGEKCCSPRGSA